LRQTSHVLKSQAAASLVANPARFRQLRGDQRMQRRQPRQPLRQATLDQPLASLINDFDVMVILSPVITHEQHRVPFSLDHQPQQRGGDPSDLMDQCSPTTRGTTSHQQSGLLTTSGRTVCRKTSTIR
jgi:hypothetical protein